MARNTTQLIHGSMMQDVWYATLRECGGDYCRRSNVNKVRWDNGLGWKWQAGEGAEGQDSRMTEYREREKGLTGN